MLNAVSSQPKRKPRTLAIEWYSQLTNRCPRSRDISSQICSKIARSRLPRPCLTAYISGTRALIGQRFSPLDRAGPEVSKNVVKGISRPNPPGRDLRKFESVYLQISGSGLGREIPLTTFLKTSDSALSNGENPYPI